MSGGVRSCVLPGGRHDELPPGAYACPACQRGLVRRLADIETYLSIITPTPIRSGGGGPASRQYGSRPPLRLDVVAMLDPRTGVTGHGPDDQLDEIPNVWADLAGWCELVRDEHPDHPTGAGPWFLRAWCSWIVHQPLVDEFAAAIARVHGALRQACGDAPRRPFARCPAIHDGTVCDGPLAMLDDSTGAQCRTCRASWRRDQLLDLMERVDDGRRQAG